MAKESKRLAEAAKSIDCSKLYDAKEALGIIQRLAFG